MRKVSYNQCPAQSYDLRRVDLLLLNFFPQIFCKECQDVNCNPLIN